jgi:hypothetical protein
LLVDEIDKMSPCPLLNLMERGIVAETKYGKTRSAQIMTSVFATSNNIKNMSVPLYRVSSLFVQQAYQMVPHRFDLEVLFCYLGSS